jgi:tetratricopeptide (TPR) repeat protein
MKNYCQQISLSIAALALLSLTQTLSAQVKVSSAFVPRKEAKEKIVPDPQKLTDIVRVKVDADSSGGIEKVVFEIDDQFRAEVKKPPYQFDWDTLAENDGAHTLGIIAYNINGQTGVQRLKVNVENKLALGIEHWVQAGLTAFRRGDAEAMERAARKAFRINNRNPESARLMALLRGVQGDIGGAFGMLNDQQNNIPKDDSVTQEVTAYLTLSRGVYANTVAAMVPDLNAALALMKPRAKAIVREAQAAYPPDKTDAKGHIARGDACLQVNQADEAAKAYEMAVSAASSDTVLRRTANRRLALAYLNLFRMKDAEKLIGQLLSGSDATITDSALWGTYLFMNRKYQQAKEAVRDAGAKRNAAGLCVAVLSDLAMGARSFAYKEARDAVEIADTAETQYVAQAALADAGDQANATKSFQTAYLRAPFFFPTLVSRGYEIMAYGKGDERFVDASNIFDAVLRFEPDNAGALAGRALAYTAQRRFAAALPLLKKLQNVDPLSPDLAVLTAAQYEQSKETFKAAQDALGRARRIDPVNFKDVSLPSMPEFAVRMARLRRVIPLSPRLLDIADNPSPIETAVTTVSK